MTKELTNAIMALIEAIIETGARAPYLYPTPENGIQAEWSVPGNAFDSGICFYPNGEVVAVWGGEFEDFLDPHTITPDSMAQLLRKAGIAKE
jgi:hypothetical protein